MTEKPIDEVYRDRNLLACALVTANNDVMGGWTPADDTDDDWVIVWLETPMGQLSWHVPRDLVDTLDVHRNDAYAYDGHSREVKNERLASWIKEGCWR